MENAFIFEQQVGGYKIYEKERFQETKFKKAKNLIASEIAKQNSGELVEILGSKSFDYPKPISLLKYIIGLYQNKNCTVLDFFAGSGTTGHAVLELNQEDNGNRTFILCTNNENNICEDVTYQRLKTIITGIRKDASKYSDGLPTNLKYFKCDLVDKATEDVDDVLMEKATELIELENHIDVSDPSIAIIYDEEDLDDLLANFDERIKHIYVSSDIATTGEQEIFLSAHKVQLTEIPHHYYKEV
jgi:adenine-specific DNA-methyltransferase